MERSAVGHERISVTGTPPDSRRTNTTVPGTRVTTEASRAAPEVLVRHPEVGELARDLLLAAVPGRGDRDDHHREREREPPALEELDRVLRARK